MLVLSLPTLLEQATLGGGEKRYSGNVGDITQLFAPSSTASLERLFRCYAFLAFDPRADDAFNAYLTRGTLDSDAGPEILALFTTAIEAPLATPVNVDLFEPWLKLDSRELPAQLMLRDLFAPRPQPALPGIVFFENFSDDTEAIYFPLADEDTEAKLRQRIRKLCALVRALAAVSTTRRPLAERIAVQAEAERLMFDRTGKISVRQWLVRSWHLVQDHAGDLVAVAGLIPGV